jgi:hypothetical protein
MKNDKVSRHRGQVITRYVAKNEDHRSSRVLRYIIQSGVFRAQASPAHFVMKHRSAARLSRGYTRFRAAVPSQHWRERCLRTPVEWTTWAKELSH